MTDLERRVYAATVIGEAGGEGSDGMAAVAWVIRNRVTRSGWPNGVIGVCLQALQFSFWNGDSKRRAALLSDESQMHMRAANICTAVWMDEIPDPTGGADHYHTVDVSPSWAAELTRTVTIKRHVFYRRSA